MNRFYLITNRDKDDSLKMTYRMRDYIVSKGGCCALAAEKEPIPEGTECVLVLGGDGTLIRAVREMKHYDLPLVGINMGNLGYLTEAEVGDMERSLDILMSDEAFAEERMMLSGNVEGKMKDVAFNDIVLTRSGAPRVLAFDIYVNGELLNSYRADGVIISTPTGSTAYNLSAGGPIVEPTASLIVITTICSHALNNSSIVLSADDEITLVVGEGREGRTEHGIVSFDGDVSVEVQTGDKIRIRKAEETAKLMRLSKVSFLETLRRKMKGN